MKHPAVFAILALSALPACNGQPPFDNTVYFAADIVTASDPSAFRALSFRGTVTEEEYANDCDENFAGEAFYAFEADYSRGQSIDFLIDQEFQSELAARDIAEIYAPILGQMPYLLRRGVDVVIVRTRGDNWCATTGQIEIEHANYAEELADGALEEAMMHETVHATLDDDHAASAGWRQAQQMDAVFVSDYARQLPEDEDLAETFTAYYGLVRGRLDANDQAAVQGTIPSRLAYLRRNFPLSELAPG